MKRAILMAPLLVAGTPPLGAARSDTVDVRVQITDLRSTRGVVRACLTSDSRDFPSCRGEDAKYDLVVRATDAGSVIFTGVHPGTYAIALLHDENDNGKADRMLGMMPTEGFGFSRDARVRMGPPHFGDAAFTVSDTPINQTIRMRYMF